MPRWTKAELEHYTQKSGKQNASMKSNAAMKPNAPSMRKKFTPSEHAIQAAFIRWTNLVIHQYPALENLFAIPNGGLRPYKIDKQGRRYSAVGRKMKAEGVKEGPPDLLLLVARLGYHGLGIETKRPGGRLSPAQQDWHERLTREGYFVKTCYSVEEMIATTKWYLR